jgi:hypothetical protein
MAEAVTIVARPLHGWYLPLSEKTRLEGPLHARLEGQVRVAGKIR